MNITTTYIPAIYTSFDGKNQLEKYYQGFLQNTLLYYMHNNQQIIDLLAEKHLQNYPEKVDVILNIIDIKVVKIPENIYDEMIERSTNPHVIEWRNGNKYMELLYNKCEDISEQYDFYNPSI